jgi:signal transduction histidine kinase
MEEALETRRAQERYIDTTSHEMRNPLSAILQSADSITGSLNELKIGNGLTEAQQDVLDATIDSAQTITLVSICTFLLFLCVTPGIRRITVV